MDQVYKMQHCPSQLNRDYKATKRRGFFKAEDKEFIRQDVLPWFCVDIKVANFEQIGVLKMKQATC